MRGAIGASVMAVGALLLAGAGPAGAQAPGDEAAAAAAAQEFSFAAYRLRLAIKAQVPEIERRADALTAPGCRRALRRAPERVEDEAAAYATVALTDALFGPLKPALLTYVVELQRVPVADRTLRSGRAAWRKTARLVGAFPTAPPDLCAQLDRWRRSGYARDARPAVNLDAVEHSEQVDDGTDRKLELAAARMRELGVGAGAAGRFAGDALFNGLEDVLDTGSDEGSASARR